MSAEKNTYSPVYIGAWTILSIILGVVFLAMFVLCKHLLDAGQIVWDLLRWLASPLI